LESNKCRKILIGVNVSQAEVQQRLDRSKVRWTATQCVGIGPASFLVMINFLTYSARRH